MRNGDALFKGKPIPDEYTSAENSLPTIKNSKDHASAPSLGKGAYFPFVLHNSGFSRKSVAPFSNLIIFATESYLLFHETSDAVFSKVHSNASKFVIPYFLFSACNINQFAT